MNLAPVLVACPGCGEPFEPNDGIGGQACSQCCSVADERARRVRAVSTAVVALNALERITALLDDDCDETRVALYNPRATVAAIRRELESAAEDLTALDREVHS